MLAGRFATVYAGVPASVLDVVSAVAQAEISSGDPNRGL